MPKMKNDEDTDIVAYQRRSKQNALDTYISQAQMQKPLICLAESAAACVSMSVTA